MLAPIAGRLSEAVPVRWLLGAGLGLVGAGLVLMHGLSPESGWTALLAGFVVAGAGSGLVNPPLASTAIGVAPQQRSGMASGINNTFRQVGIATGVAALGAIFQSHIHGASPRRSPGRPPQVVDRLAQAAASGSIGRALGNLPPQAREPVAGAARGAFVDGLDRLFLISAALAFLGAILAVALVRGEDFEQHGEPPDEETPERGRDRERVGA